MSIRRPSTTTTRSTPSACIPRTSPATGGPTVPLNGIYVIQASVKWEFNLTGNRRLKIRRNGQEILASQEIKPNSGWPVTHILSTVERLSAGDFVEAVVHQTSGGDLDVTLGNGTEFIMYRISSP